MILAANAGELLRQAMPSDARSGYTRRRLKRTDFDMADALTPEGAEIKSGEGVLVVEKYVREKPRAADSLQIPMGEDSYGWIAAVSRDGKLAVIRHKEAAFVVDLQNGKVRFRLAATTYQSGSLTQFSADSSIFTNL